METMDGLLQWRVWMVCSTGEYEWSAAVERLDGLL
jgi:hypothetical protein